jgi:magnesium and cobalt transporter
MSFLTSTVRQIKCLGQKLGLTKSKACATQSTNHLQAKDPCSQIEMPELTIGYLNMPIYEVMIPRSDIEAVSLHDRFDEVVRKFLRSGFLWLPVYRDSLDTIVGLISVHSILSLRERDQASETWFRHLNTPLFCPSALTVREAFERLQNPHKMPMIFVVDEYGGIEGMLTRWMLINGLLQIYGDDLTQEDEMVISRDPIVVINGRMDLESFEDEFDAKGLFTQEDEERINTVGGWLCTHLGRVPLTGEIITHSSGFTFEVRQATPRRIHQIALVHLPAGLGVTQDK